MVKFYMVIFNSESLFLTDYAIDKLLRVLKLSHPFIIQNVVLLNTL